MLDCQLFGLNPAGPHLVNVLLHTIAALLLFLVLWQMTGGLWQSAFVAALFAIHPLHVESVAWISERKDVLSGVLFMLTLGAYTRYARRPTVSRYITMSIWYALGLMAKPMLVTLPFVFLLLDYWPLKRSQKSEVTSQKRETISSLIVEKIPLFALAAGSCLMTLIAQSRAMHHFKYLPFSMRLGNAFSSCLTYVWQMFWPARLAVFYPYASHGRAAAFLAVVFVIAISVSVLVLRQIDPYLFVGWFWYLVMLVPVIGLVQVGLQSHADRYTYLPHIGLYLAATWLVTDLSTTWQRRPLFLSIGAAIVVGMLSWSAREQTRYWHDSGTLWRHALAVTQNNYLAHNNLAAFLDTGDEAIWHLKETVKLQPDYAKGHYDLARLLLDQREVNQAIDHLRKTVALDPQLAEPWSDLGDALHLKGKAREATDCYERALHLSPELRNSLTGLGWILATCPDGSLRNGTRAVQLATKAVEISQRQRPIALRTLAAAYAEAGQFDQATAVATEALKLAVAQSNSELASKLRLEIDLYQTKLPLRDSAQTTSPGFP